MGSQKCVCTTFSILEHLRNLWIKSKSLYRKSSHSSTYYLAAGGRWTIQSLVQLCRAFVTPDTDGWLNSLKAVMPSGQGTGALECLYKLCDIIETVVSTTCVDSPVTCGITLVQVLMGLLIFHVHFEIEVHLIHRLFSGWLKMCTHCLDIYKCGIAWGAKTCCFRSQWKMWKQATGAALSLKFIVIIHPFWKCDS